MRGPSHSIISADHGELEDFLCSALPQLILRTTCATWVGIQEKLSRGAMARFSGLLAVSMCVLVASTFMEEFAGATGICNPNSLLPCLSAIQGAHPPPWWTDKLVTFITHSTGWILLEIRKLPDQRVLELQGVDDYITQGNQCSSIFAYVVSGE